MSCQSVPGHRSATMYPVLHWASSGPGVSRGPHEISLVPFIGFFGVGKDTGAP
ncbi:unnamed protein product [Staurois parvus]|uniref:Uncharacterized protein n=1 Tax=Staurois parvus TaxID=386267 RepID=A0ABN9ER49_9NEOB|nr:unnamed protein product [Staurois parvus]